MSKFFLSAFADESDQSLAGQIAALKRNGARLIELRNVDGKNVSDLTVEEAEAIAKALFDEGISVSSIGSPIGKIGAFDDFAPHMEKYRHTLKLAKIFKTNKIRLFSFYIPRGEDPASYRDEVLSRMEQIVAAAKEEGICPCHENEMGIYGEKSAAVLDLHSRFGRDLGEIFDPANYIHAKEYPADIIDGLLPYIEYMHIKDAVYEGGAVVPSGEGDGSIPLLLEKLAATDKDYILTLEPHLSVFKGLSDLQDEELTHKHIFKSAEEAFDAGFNALKKILDNGGYDYE